MVGGTSLESSGLEQNLTAGIVVVAIAQLVPGEQVIGMTDVVSVSST